MINNTGDADINNPVKIRILLAITFLVFAVGCIGMLLTLTRAVFIHLTPYIIMLSMLLVLFFTRPITFKTVLVFLLIATLGFFIEVIGVNTYVIFGHYVYGKTLGISVFNTPLLIGINWLFLIYSSSSLMEKFSLNNTFKILLASLLMLVYDIILEPVAIKTDMWYWMDSAIPLRNYIAWFVIAVILHSILRATGINLKNPVAPGVLVCQLLFFLTLHIFLK